MLHRLSALNTEFEACEKHLNFFVDKVTIIRVSSLVSYPSVSVPCSAVFHQFQPVTSNFLFEIADHLKPPGSSTDVIRSIHPFSIPVGSQGAGAYSSGHRARGGVHPGQVASPSQGHTETNETHNHTRSHSLLRTILETPIYLTGLWEEAGVPTHTRGEHANSTQKVPGVEPGSLLL